MQEKIKRDPLAHLKSLEMDPDRKMLVVEGTEDRLLIEYLSDDQLDRNLVILEIDSIDINESLEGGNRGRLLYFASLTSKETERLSFFIDKDYSHYLKEELPPTVTQTDFKDLESYLIDKDCISKFLKIGLKSEKIAADDLLEEIKKAQYFGFVRIASLKNGFNLSVNKTNERLSKYLTIDSDFKVKIKTKEYLTSLIQNSVNKIIITELETALENIKKELQSEDYRFIIHGKDLLALIAEISKKMGLKKDNIDNIFWMSLEKNRIAQYKNLHSIIEFCKNSLS